MFKNKKIIKDCGFLLFCVLFGAWLYDFVQFLISWFQQGVDMRFFMFLFIGVLIDNVINIFAVKGDRLEQIAMSLFFSGTSSIIYLPLCGLMINSPLGNYMFPSDKWFAMIFVSIPLILSFSLNYLFLRLYMKKRFNCKNITFDRYLTFIEGISIWCTIFSFVNELTSDSELLSTNFCAVLCFYAVLLNFCNKMMKKYRQKRSHVSKK